MSGNAKAASLLVATTLLGTAFAGTDVSFEEETFMSGVNGPPGSAGRGTRTRTELKGDVMRTETGTEVTIVDLGAESVFTLDTRRKTYRVTTFEEMRASLESAMTEPAVGASGSGDISATTDVRVSESGTTESIAGHEARQLLIETDVTLESASRDESGVVTMLSELWVASDVPGAEELRSFQSRMAEKLGTSELARTMFAAGPGVSSTGASVAGGASMSRERLAQEMKKVEGFPLRTVTYFGPGGNGNANGMKVTRETRTIETAAVDPGRFVVPSDYRRVE